MPCEGSLFPAADSAAARLDRVAEVGVHDVQQVVDHRALLRAGEAVAGEEGARRIRGAEEDHLPLRQQLEAVEAGENLGRGLVDDAEDRALAQAGGEALEDARDVVRRRGVQACGGSIAGRGTSHHERCRRCYGPERDR